MLVSFHRSSEGATGRVQGPHGLWTRIKGTGRAGPSTHLRLARGKSVVPVEAERSVLPLRGDGEWVTGWMLLPVRRSDGEVERGQGRASCRCLGDSVPQVWAGPRGAAVPLGRQGTVSQAVEGHTTASGAATVLGQCPPAPPPPQRPRDRGSLPGQAKDFGLTCSRAAFGRRKLKADWLERGRRAVAASICGTEVSRLHTAAGRAGAAKRPPPRRAGAGDPGVFTCRERN